MMLFFKTEETQVAKVPHLTSRQGDRDHSINNTLHPNLFQHWQPDANSVQGKFHDTLHLTSDKSYHQEQQQQNFIPFSIIYMNFKLMSCVTPTLCFLHCILLGCLLFTMETSIRQGQSKYHYYSPSNYASLQTLLIKQAQKVSEVVIFVLS